MKWALNNPKSLIAYGTITSNVTSVDVIVCKKEYKSRAWILIEPFETLWFWDYVTHKIWLEEWHNSLSDPEGNLTHWESIMHREPFHSRFSRKVKIPC